MQIVSFGSQDEYLTGEPDITFFKMAFKKHVNFAMESVMQDVTMNGDIGTVVLSRSGDLITNSWVECEYEDEVGDHKSAFDLIEYIDFLIGEQVIDRHYTKFYEMWYKLSTNQHKYDGYEELVNINKSNKKVFLPLEFFFSKDYGLALPIIALQYHEISFRIKFKENISNPRVFVDYVYLEQEERIRLAQMEHTIVIEQLQYSGDANSQDNGNKYLNLSHPVKELLWKYKDTSNFGGDVTIKLNEYNKIFERESMYFTHIQPYQHHTNVPDVNNSSGTTVDNLKHIYSYSFALRPEDYQPSGSCNFSRLKSAQIKSSVGRGIEVFAINYNVLKITSGMAGLLF